MCVALICPPKVRPSLTLLKACERANPHGAGIAWRDRGKIHYRKNLRAADVRRLALDHTGELVIHFRWASVGGIDPLLCHPFPTTAKAELVEARKATPKLDGIRCLKINGRAHSRSFKPISNDYVRRWVEANLPDGVDGELMQRGGTFSETTSIIGREKGTPDFVFHIFDYVSAGISEPYAQRMINLIALDLPEKHTQKVLPKLCKNLVALAEFESQCVAEGFEGVMIRTPSSPYKCGRSTENEGYLLKIKRFEDSEATVLDTYEGMSNQNVAMQDAFGRTTRSSAQDGKVGRGELGGFIVRTAAGVEFRLGYTTSPVASIGSASGSAAAS